MAATAAGDNGPNQVFSGDTEDSEEYRRFKTWCTNKMLTMEKLPAKARGAYVYTLLSGKALECVEHLDMASYHVENGDQVIWKLLDERFPVKAKTDEMGELLTEVFLLKSKEGETVKAWVARSSELFDRLARKTQVDFPGEARGWIILHRAGLSDSEKAVVLARAQGSLKREDISQAIRSCFPDKVLSSKKSYAANLVETGEIDLEDLPDEPNSEEFHDIEMFLTEHQRDLNALEGESFAEQDVAEVLAVTWREKRQELAKLQKARNFRQVKETKRAFRVEIEEMKKKTRCHRCGKLGHWSRECKQPRNSGDKGPTTTPSKSSMSTSSGAALVQDEQLHFIASVDDLTLLEKLRQRLAVAPECHGTLPPDTNTEVLLVSSPGYGVLDSGCGKTIIGEQTLERFRELLVACGMTLPEFEEEINHFRYGNGQSEVSDKTVKLPVQLGGRKGALRAAIVKGKAPLLISRSALQTLRASLDFKDNVLTLFDDRVQVPLQVNEAGQYVVRLLPEIQPHDAPAEAEVLATSPAVSSSSMPSQDSPETKNLVLKSWMREDSGCKVAPFTNSTGPRKEFIHRRQVKCAITQKLLLDQDGVGKWNTSQLKTPLPVGYDHVHTILWHDDPRCVDRPPCQKSSDQVESDVSVDSLSQQPVDLTKHQLRQIRSQVAQGCAAVQGQYTREFVEAVLQTVPSFAKRVGSLTNEVLEVVEDQLNAQQWEILAAAKIELQKSGADLQAVIDKLHRNLGHPPNHDMVRILRHALASDEAVKLARDHKCSFCESRVKPRVPIPVQTQRASQFNQQIGLDVKYLRGWKSNQKVKALNIVDQASCFQRVVPFFETETATLLRSLLDQHWISWTGPPSEIVLDAAQTNLADPMFIPAETQGTNMRVIPADAHWQLGRTENHGGWFQRILDKIIDEHTPKTKEEWLECVQQAHVKNEMIQTYGFTPHQFVFGRNPRVPSELLDEPLQIVPATASLHDNAAARAQAIRQTARKAVLDLQDNKALRQALLARPRVSIPFAPGDLVAYWRSQKWIQGELHNQGRWYGTAVVLGYIGKNLLIAHRKQILRCAPEQVRYATAEEKTLLQTPHVELLGIKDMIEGGTFRSQQFTDLVSQSYPTVAEPRSFEHEHEQPVSTDRFEVPDTPMEPVVPSEQPEVPVESAMPANVPEVPAESSESAMPSNPEASAMNTGSETSSYGPMRRRVYGKDGPQALYRPPALQMDDFIDVIREAVPSMIDQLQHGTKRDHSDVSADSAEPASPSEPSSSRPRTQEVLSVQHFETVDNWSTEGFDKEVLIAGVSQKENGQRTSSQ
eukprot:s3028_g4.t1